MKKLLALILAALILLSLVACNETRNNDNGDGDDTEGNGINNDVTDDNGNINTNNDNENNEQSVCTTHNYIGNICSVCGCSLWNGETDTSWYSVMDLEFTISTAEQFAGLIDIVNDGSDFENVKITLANHIDMNGTPISPIGATSENVFLGEFDGNNYSISNVIIDTNSIILSEDKIFEETYYSAYVGLFGYSKGAVSNINVKNLSINISSETINYLYIGGLVALCDANIDNCSVQGEIVINTNNQFSVGGIVASTSGNITRCSSDISIVTYLSCEDFNVNPNMAGLVAHSSDNTVRECLSKGSITFTMTHDEVEINELYMGGLIGVSSEVNVVNCYSSVDVTASVIRNNVCYVGGLLGKMAKGTVKFCYSTGNISLNCRENGYAGSLIGYIRADYFSSVMSTISVSDCFAVGNIHCETENADGVSATIGQNAHEVITNCYYLANQVITGDEIVKDGTPANQSDLINTAFYKNRMSWDSEIWNLTDGAYPVLK